MWVQRPGLPERGQLLTARQQALLAHIELVLEDQLQELQVIEAVAGGFL